MSEEQAKTELFRIHKEYIKNPPQKRLELYEEYKKNRERVHQALARATVEKKSDSLLEKELSLESFKIK